MVKFLRKIPLVAIMLYYDVAIYIYTRDSPAVTFYKRCKMDY